MPNRAEADREQDEGEGNEPVEPQQGCSSPVPIRLVTKTTEVKKKRETSITAYIVWVWDF